MRRRSYTTQSGDMWDGIAHRVYRDRKRGEMLMHLLLEANPAHRKTVIFSSGVVLTVPEPPVSMPETLPPWKR